MSDLDYTQAGKKQVAPEMVEKDGEGEALSDEEDLGDDAERRSAKVLLATLKVLACAFKFFSCAPLGTLFLGPYARTKPAIPGRLTLAWKVPSAPSRGGFRKVISST